VIREPAVAGTFYGARAGALATEVDGYLRAGAAAGPVEALGVVVPHAGYVYSGAVAGAVFGRISISPSVIVLGPNHTGLGQAVALWPGGAWRTPLGEAAVDAALTAALAAEAGVSPDPLAHRREHSLEVQVPFLQRRRPGVALAALCLSHLSFEECEALGEAVGRVAAAAGALVIASSDMSHYVPAAQARELDARALERVLALDARGLHEVVHRDRISMCGVVPTTVMLVAARARGAARAELVCYAHSGEVTGDERSVVGYAGVIVA
jgi:AmmeMemoRadiSam system protein B